MSYGTVMVGKVKPGMQQAWLDGLAEWKKERVEGGQVDGYRSEYTLLGDDGVSVASCVIFESKEKYMALADDPTQDTWWQEKVVPLLDGDVTWTDGTWA